jgi:putative OPT family oligopeptide transporter
VVAMAAAIAGDTSQDLKTGFLLGATPWKQQAGELVGVLTSMMLIGGTVLLLHKAYVIGSANLPAPQATLMSLVVDGVIDRNLPWTLVFIGAGIALVFELFRIPSLPMAVGLYLPLATTMPIFIGGVIHKAMKHTVGGEGGDDPGVLFGSGMVGGEGLVGVLLALMLVAPSTQALSERMQGFGGSWWTPLGAWGDLLSLVIFAILAVLLIRTAKARAAA